MVPSSLFCWIVVLSYLGGVWRSFALLGRMESVISINSFIVVVRVRVLGGKERGGGLSASLALC